MNKLFLIWFILCISCRNNFSEEPPPSYEINPREEFEFGTDSIYWKDSMYVYTIKMDTVYFRPSKSKH